MMAAGIEAMSVFGGTAYLDVMQWAQQCQLDTTRFENLLMKEKAVALPHEDPVTCGVNAAKARVIASDISRFMVAEGGDVLTMDWSYAEPSSGAGAVAILVSGNPYVFQVDVGANGYYGYEVMDTCRPLPDSEAGDADLSLLSYLDCCEQAFLEYQKRVSGVDYRETFGYLTFHTPFGGMVKGAHRTMMRKMAGAKPAEIEADFQKRVTPGLKYCQRVGNIMGGTVFLSLASTIDYGQFDTPQRVGCFSYGSGCCSEFDRAAAL